MTPARWNHRAAQSQLPRSVGSAGSSLTGEAKTQPRPQPLCGGLSPPGAAPKPGNVTFPRRGWTSKGGRPNKLPSQKNPDTVTTKVRPVQRVAIQISVWAFGPKNIQEGFVLGEPQPCCPHHLCCSILRGYKMAVKPVAQQQLAQSQLGHPILEKQRQKPASAGPQPQGGTAEHPPHPCLWLPPWVTPSPPARSSLEHPRSAKSLQRTMNTSTLARPCRKQAAAQARHPRGNQEFLQRTGLGSSACFE